MLHAVQTATLLVTFTVQSLRWEATGVAYCGNSLSTCYIYCIECSCVHGGLPG